MKIALSQSFKKQLGQLTIKMMFALLAIAGGYIAGTVQATAGSVPSFHTTQ